MFLWINSPTRTTTPVRQNRPIEEIAAPKKKKSAAAVFTLGKLKLPQGLAILLVGIGLLVVLALVNRYQESVTLSGVQVNVIAKADNAFMNDERVMEAMGWVAGVAPLGEKMDMVHLKELEDSLRKSPFVKDAELYKSIQGVLHVEVTMREPVARLMNNSGADVYIDANGKKFPVSTIHSANVPLVRGDFDEAVADTFSCETVLSALPVLTFIKNDPFWNDYISEISVDGNGELTLYPRMDPMSIEFGHAIRISEKFRDTKVFLDQVMSHSDRPRFKQISVKYNGQVVATKR